LNQDGSYSSLEFSVKGFSRPVDILPPQAMPRRGSHTPASEDARIGQRIKDTRVSRGVQQKALAARLGMGQSVLSRYERGVLRLPSSLLARIASELRVSSDEILGLKTPKSDATVRDRRFLKRLHAIDTLPERQKDALLTTIDGLLRSVKAS
jgi:transcriptional regulator with XRE-family HTH domain